MKKNHIFLILMMTTLTGVNSAPSALERINECRQKAVKLITDINYPYKSGVVEVRTRAGSFAGVSCSRNEESGSLANQPPVGYAFEAMELHTGNWENANFDGNGWSPSGTFGTLKVHGHGCDRKDDAVAQAWWTGTIRRVVSQADSDEIWQKCIDQETKK